MTSTLLEHRNGTGDDADSPNPSDAQLDLLADFRSELEDLTSAQRELLSELRAEGAVNLDDADLPRLRQENEELRALVAQLERMLGAAPAGAEQPPELEHALGEHSPVIRELQAKMQQSMEYDLAAAAPAEQVRDAVIERMKRELEQQRAQLEEDEAAMMEQMRTMEMALAKDRAELARQRSELQRQQADFTREIENASRDPQLHERLASLRRRSGDALAVKNLKDSSATTNARAVPPKSSGLIRRIFG